LKYSCREILSYFLHVSSVAHFRGLGRVGFGSPGSGGHRLGVF
jgi:hypothetical protein